MTIARRFAALTLRAHLRIAFAAVALTAILATSIVSTTMATNARSDRMRNRSTQYARSLQLQLEPVVAFDDALTAREVFQSFAGDTDVEGLAVYGGRGELIAGEGAFPARLGAGEHVTPSPDRFVALAPVVSREGPRGRVYVSLSTRSTQIDRRRSIVTAVVTAFVAFALALLLAHLITRRLANRVAKLSGIATRIAAGEFVQPSLTELDDPKSELGQLERSLGIMARELEQLFTEQERLAHEAQTRLESLVAKRTQELERSREQYRLIAESTNAIPFALDLDRGRFTYAGPQAVSRLGWNELDWKMPGFLDRLLPRERAADVRKRLDECTGGSSDFECEILSQAGRVHHLRWVVSCETTVKGRSMRGLMVDVTAQRTLERELAQAQKLESVGRLASGVAHEINTPVQFVSDSVNFVREALADVTTSLHRYRALADGVQAGTNVTELAREVREADSAADLDWVLDNVAPALDRALDGLGRVTVIVRSMKEFAHPDRREKSPTDLNRGIESTLVVAKNEYKYVADVETELGELPLVTCHGGEINQVVLNLVVNAAHAIEAVVKGTSDRGTIRLSTRLDGEQVELRISDTGTGIPSEIANKIFDPFFTTKEIGKGTGQGLALARTIVEGHGGTLRFETEMGRGTTFVIRLPVDDPTPQRAAA